MPEAEFQALHEALSSVHPQLKSSAIAAEARTLLKTEVVDLNDIVQMLSGMNATRAGSDIPLEQFVRDASRAPLARWGEKPKQFDVALFEKRLLALLSIEPLMMSARATDVQHEYDHLFHSARILTDVRPLFDSSGAEVRGALIVHNLRVTYYEMGEYKEMFFALDNSDLAKFRKVLDRAEQKTASLEAMVSKAGVPYFESK